MPAPSIRSLAILLAMLTAVAPFAVDMYLPAMQAMALDLSTPIHYVEVSVSTFLFGFAIGQLIGGPASDRFGRKPMITLGLILFSITSLLLTQTESIDQLLFLRALQAIGGGMATVNSSAMIRDLFSGDEMAKVLSMVAIVMMSAPLIAPMLGALIVKFFDWQAIFLCLSLYSILVMLLLLWRLPETNTQAKRNEKESESGKPKLWQSYKRVLTHRQAMGYIMAISFAFSGMFVFITSSAFTYLEYYSVSVQLFPFLFGANVLVMMLMNRINVWALNHYASASILTTGLLIQLACGIALIIASYTQADLYLIVVLNMLFVGSLGLIAANATAGTLNFFPDISGTATAVIGVTEFTLGAIVGIFWSYLHELQFIATQQHTLSPMAWVMAGCALIGLVGLKILSKTKTVPKPL
ncbi:MAG: DHA1 family bicyclomycin/chloramphenicol resistance-like MFS transporter [Oleispira sp.]|jgi:DHA1 family bicyclomycin/chloramphenicol resistance-like MFS transporter